jgi:radical SAM protein with 4Fe4S-binding SPASM domain
MSDYVEFLYDDNTNNDSNQSLFELIIPGAACNMKCKYCFGEHSLNIRNTCNTKLNEKALDEVLKDVDHNSSKLITIWGGEPLFNKDQLLEAVAYIKDRFPNAHLDMVVNGSLLNDYWTKFLIDNKIFIGISHDGPGQKYRSQGVDFLEQDEIKNNIIQLRKARLFSTFNTIFHRLNPSIEEIHKYYAKKEEEYKIELGVAPRLVRYINELSEPFMFKKEDFPALDKAAEYIVNFYMRALLDNDVRIINKYLGGPLKHAITYTIENLSGVPFVWQKDSPYCGTLTQLKVTTNGDKVFCNGVTETGDIERAKRLLTTYKSWDNCEKCDANYVCRGLCSANSYEQLQKNCDMYKFFYSKLREHIESFMEQK